MWLTFLSSIDAVLVSGTIPSSEAESIGGVYGEHNGVHGTSI